MASEPDPAEVQRRLATRMAELEAAHKRILELMDKEIALREYKRKLAAAREERDALRGSLEYRLGHKLISPFRKLSRALAGGRKKKDQPVEPEVTLDTYHEWFLKERASDADLAAMRTASAEMRVAIGIVLPVRDTPLPLLDKAVSSIQAQSYPHWELLLVDSKSEDSHAAARLREFAASDSRIRAKFLDGPDLASNAALEMDSREFVGFLDGDGWLEPDALFRMAQLLHEHPATDIVYSDEDEIDGAGRFHDPFFKPGWSPDALLSGNYIGQFTLLRRGLVAELGDFEGAYDLLLRATERTEKILHLPRVLHHSLRAARLEPAAIERGSRALREALARRKIQGEVMPAGRWGYRVRRAILDHKKIAIIIPTRDRLELLRRCVESICARTDYPDYEIVIAYNDSREVATSEYYETIPHRIVRYPGPFNYSAINNYAVRETDAPWILFLNNDTEVIDREWLSSMAEHIQRPEVGAVGAKLLYPHGTIQHAGVILTPKVGPATHVHVHAPGDSWENGGQIQWVGNYSAVTAGCMLTRRDVFEQVGGFDECQLPVAFNDVDYCLKLRAAGFRIVYTPYARLYHYESASRGRGKSNPAEKRLLRERWPDVLAHDPLTNLSLVPFTRKPPAA